MDNTKRTRMNVRKAFDSKLYKVGKEAEKLIQALLQTYGHELIENLDDQKFIVEKNTNIYGVDLLIFKKLEDGSLKEIYGIEVVRRASIKYNTIFLEANKANYYNTGLPIFFIVVNNDLTDALVLDTDKLITNYPLEITNFNENKEKELNYLVPRTDFIKWKLNH